MTSSQKIISTTETAPCSTPLQTPRKKFENQSVTARATLRMVVPISHQEIQVFHFHNDLVILGSKKGKVEANINIMFNH
jgi:hypothetical protein